MGFDQGIADKFGKKSCPVCNKVMDFTNKKKLGFGQRDIYDERRRQ